MTILLAALLAQDTRISAFDVSSDGTRLLTGGWDGRARVWDAASLKPLGAMELGDTTVVAARFSPDGTKIATLGVRDTVELWEQGKIARRFKGVPLGQADVAFSADGRRLVAATARGDLIAWDVADGRVVLERRTEVSYSNGWALSPAGNRWAWAGLDGLRIVDVESGEASVVKGQFHRIAFSPDGSHLVVQDSAVGPLVVLDARGTVKLRLMGLKGYLCALAFSRDHRLLAAGDNEGEARVWRIDGPERIVTVRGIGQAAVQLTFSPDGRVLYSAWDKGKILATPLIGGGAAPR